MKLMGTVLILLGLAALGFRIWPWAPMEEPASLRNTPSPSPWVQEEFERELRRAVWIARFVRYGLIPTGLILLGGGIWCLTSDRRRKNE